MHSEEDKLSPEDKKRRLKTPSQVAALEEFYNGMDFPYHFLGCVLAFTIAKLLDGIVIVDHLYSLQNTSIPRRR